jgi:3-oxoacyl-[acyl-carrier-protein] synthase-1
VHGAPRLDPFEMLDRRTTRFMGKGAAWNYIAMQEAIAMAGLEEADIKNPRTGIIMGSGGPSTRTIVEAADITREKGPKRIGPLRRAQGDVVDRLGDARHLVQDQGRELHDLLGLRDEQALHRQCLRADPVGKQDIVFAGGHEDLDWTMSQPVRRDGRDVVRSTTTRRTRLARL